MSDYDQKETWVDEVNMVAHNSFGKVDEENQVEVRFTIAANYQSSDDVKSRRKRLLKIHYWSFVFHILQKLFHFKKYYCSLLKGQ